MLSTAARNLGSRSFATTSAAGKKFDLTGIYPPVTTPFNADETPAWDRLGENLTKYAVEAPQLRGYLVQGSNGEYCYMSAEERVEMVRKVRAFASDDKLLLAGSGCESTAHTINMTSAMAGAGADAVVVITPCYFKGRMNASALLRHYEAVADASPIPVILYSVPANTTVDLPAEVAAKLADHPNVVGIKDSGGDIAKIGLMAHLTKGKDFQILAGSASFLLSALHVGAVGGICALANALPNQVCRLQELYRQGDSARAEASELQRRLVGPNAAVTKTFGVAGMKTAMDLYGFYGGPTRRPLLPLEADEKEKLRVAFKSSGFL